MSNRPRALWSAPVLTIAAVTAIAAWPGSASANPHPDLPARTPAQLLADVEHSSVQHFSGTVVETARFGLPALPGADSAALSWQTLVTGSHTVRVWVDGASKQRIALLAQLSESDVIHNGRDLWTFASDSQTVGHATLAAQQRTARKQIARSTPVGVADEALQAIDPSTKVSVDLTQRVAGRAAYTLVLTPRDTRSTVSRIAIAIDAKRKMPLRVQVFGSATQPAFEIGFSDISFSQPSAKTFAFTAPKGATVSKDLFPLLAGRQERQATPGSKSGPDVKTVGDGWTSVLVVKGAGTGMLGGGEIGKLFTAQPDGSRLLQTALLNVLVTPDGTVALGAVQPQLLRAAVG